MLKRFRTLAAVSAAVLTPILLAPAATADSQSQEVGTQDYWGSCSSGGYTNDAGARCTTLSNGILYVRSSSPGTGITVQYDKQGGSSFQGRLGYERSSSNVYEPYRTMTATGTGLYSNQWSVSASCAPVIGKLNVSGGTTYSTPPRTPC
ncbi:hypothetical protein ACFVUW_11170 [Streptomyces xiamenensis]|uniref:hypothetical protein n=1 Tax=Streptomyces xiamenensis TaxID=408015 RepID=UPI0036EA66FE